MRVSGTGNLPALSSGYPSQPRVALLNANRLYAAYPATLRERGERYQRDGRVRLLRAGGAGIEAVVRGTAAYEVTIQLGRNGRVELACTCPYSQEHVVCKHSWAVLVEAAVRGSLPESLAHGPLNARSTSPTRARGTARGRPTREWERRLAQLRQSLASAPDRPAPAPWPEDRRLVYIIDIPGTLAANGVAVELATERRLRDGSWDRPRQFALGAERWFQVPDESDRRIAHMLLGARTEYGYSGVPSSRRFVLPENAYDTTLRLMCETGRCRLRRVAGEERPEPVEWDDGSPWVLQLSVARAAQGTGYVVDGQLGREGQSMPLAEPSLLVEAGLVIAHGSVARFEHSGAFPLVAALRSEGPVSVGARDLPRLLESLYALPNLPPVVLPPDLDITELRPEPVPFLMVGGAPPRGYGGHGLPLTLAFRYDDTEVAATRAEDSIFDRKRRIVLHRDRGAETRAEARLRELGARDEYDYQSHRPRLALPPQRLDGAVRALTAEGWRVEAEGRVFRMPGTSHATLRSGVDWFELEAGVEYGGQRASLPRLLAALRSGERTVVLDDGSLGLLPEEWLRRYATLAGAGRQVDGDGVLRFSRNQVALLDTMLASMPEVDTDQVFARAREALRGFENVEPAEAPAGFTGTLRSYQREGLGWLHFLRGFGFGGCLADDMGLGKTIQVLALLESRRESGAGPSLVVVPRSLVFNWQQEAARFTPQLRVLDHTGPQRASEALAATADYDLVVTTYGTLRQDIAELRDIHFDYVVLDEAQAIKNPRTAAAKAARLLSGEHRLALSGTPVENRLEELWSLFEFLNPGMLGSSRLFAAAGAGVTVADAEARTLLARALRPFLLRRTKDQVARDLPAKQEQTFYVELGPKQRKLYDELRDHYRTSLLGHVDRVGIRRSRIQILEALLRLRQAACHPGLLDPKRASEPGGKLDALVPMLVEAASEDHKVLVFSQFTSMLALVRRRLDAEGITYEYLDGRTRDRQARVDRFQTDPACPLFLISLKAGGQGLNLTAADYVFLLDPWWNPAVEAQAVDRAHRIGQTRPVLATRLIARDTVEERVLELQQAKRDLADAIITSDNSLIARIEREDLTLLLG